MAIKDASVLVHDSMKPSLVVKENVKHSIIIKNASYIDKPTVID